MHQRDKTLIGHRSKISHPELPESRNVVFMTLQVHTMMIVYGLVIIATLATISYGVKFYYEPKTFKYFAIFLMTVCTTKSNIYNENMNKNK